jgi:hypothetical protein
MQVVGVRYTSATASDFTEIRESGIDSAQTHIEE